MGTNDASFNDGTGIADGAITPAKRSGGFFITGFNPSGTGTLALTGAGFAPKAALFQQRADTSSTVGASATGFATPLGQRASAQYAEQGADDSARSSTSHAFIALTTNAVVVVDGVVSSWDADGITLNVTTRTGSRAFDVLLFG